PSLSSSMATVSFSLTIGSAPIRSNSRNVARALRYRRRLRRSSWLRSTCATGCSTSPCQSASIGVCPTAASACRCASPTPLLAITPRPAATAPEDTSSTSRPWSRNRAIRLASAAALRLPSPPLPSVSRLLPTLSTARCQRGIACSGKVVWAVVAVLGTAVIANVVLLWVRNAHVRDMARDQETADRQWAKWVRSRCPAMRMWIAPEVADCRHEGHGAAAAYVRIGSDRRACRSGPGDVHTGQRRYVHQRRKLYSKASKPSTFKAPRPTRGSPDG